MKLSRNWHEVGRRTMWCYTYIFNRSKFYLQAFKQPNVSVLWRFEHSISPERVVVVVDWWLLLLLLEITEIVSYGFKHSIVKKTERENKTNKHWVWRIRTLARRHNQIYFSLIIRFEHRSIHQPYRMARTLQFAHNIPYCT